MRAVPSARIIGVSMPDARLRRTRATLPEGYQFGDQRWRLTESYRVVNVSPLVWGWRPMHMNAADQLRRHADTDEPGYGAGV